MVSALIEFTTEVKLNIDNVFVALELLKKKKQGDKGKAGASSSSRKNHDEAAQQQPASLQEVFWVPMAFTTNSCADVEDDDCFVTIAPSHPVWGATDETTNRGRTRRVSSTMSAPP